MIQWLQKWYSDQCDGQWEHNHGISIGTLDNPGWSVKIDLNETNMEGIELPYSLFEVSDNEWYAYSIKNNRFDGAGDPSKLDQIIRIFKGIVEKVNNQN